MNIRHYRRMLADQVRLHAFHRAIRATVKPGDTVVEVGAGLGTYSFMAAQAGARRVYAIEADPEICRLAEAVAEQNGLSDRVKFLRGYSTDVEIPERADVAIFEDYTSFFFSNRLPDLLKDIRKRLLKPNGRLLPAAVNLYIAGYQDKELYQELDLHHAQHETLFEIDFSETRRVVMNSPTGVTATRRNLLTAPLRCAHLNLQRDDSFAFAFTGQTRAGRNGILHGLLGWMELELAPRQRLSCSPLRPPTVWGQSFYPFGDPLRIHQHQPLTLGIEFILPDTVTQYLERWRVSTRRAYREGNTFASVPFSARTLEQDSAKTRAKLGPRSRMVVTALSELRSDVSYGTVATALLKRHPGIFTSRDDALGSVVRLVPAISSLAGEI